MPISYTAGGDLSNSGKFVDQEGWYHFVVLEGKEVATKRSDGSIIQGMLGQLECIVLASNVEGQRDKQLSVCIRAPAATHKDGGDFCRKVADRWWLALSLATREQLESKQNLMIDIVAAKGRQFIAKIEKGDKYCDIAGAEVYHVDDAAVKDQKKSVDDLGKIRPEFRWISKQPAPASPAPTTPAADRDVL
jgi:hypothetical protein